MQDDEFAPQIHLIFGPRVLRWIAGHIYFKIFRRRAHTECSLCHDDFQYICILNLISNLSLSTFAASLSLSRSPPPLSISFLALPLSPRNCLSIAFVQFDWTKELPILKSATHVIWEIVMDNERWTRARTEQMQTKKLNKKKTTHTHTRHTHRRYWPGIRFDRRRL